MSASERVADRILTNLLIGIISIVFSAFANVFNEIESTTGQAGDFYPALFAILFQSAPSLITFLGIVAATVISGPLGLIGVLLEIIGVNQIINGTGGIGLTIFGAILVVGGSFVPWLKVYSAILESR